MLFVKIVAKLNNGGKKPERIFFDNFVFLFSKAGIQSSQRARIRGSTFRIQMSGKKKNLF